MQPKEMRTIPLNPVNWSFHLGRGFATRCLGVKLAKSLNAEGITSLEKAVEVTKLLEASGESPNEWPGPEGWPTAQAPGNVQAEGRVPHSPRPLENFTHSSLSIPWKLLPCWGGGRKTSKQKRLLGPLLQCWSDGSLVSVLYLALFWRDPVEAEISSCICRQAENLKSQRLPDN